MPKLDLLADDKSGPPVDDSLIAAPQDRPAFGDACRSARPRRFGADNEHPQAPAPVLRVHVLVGDAARCGDAPLRGDRLAHLARKARSFRKWSACIAFHDPDLSARGPNQPKRLKDEAAINA